MECLQLRSPPGPFHYPISEQTKSLVALQELQNEVGALLEFRDLVIETFPNLRSKMAPSTPASGTRRDWEPGVRVRRKLAAGGGDAARAKPQPSVQDSGFSTETSCGKDAHSSSASASASASRSRPLEDELWALLDVIQRKGVRLRDEVEQLRGELDDRQPVETVEDSFARALSTGTCSECADTSRLRAERDALLIHAAALEASAAAAAASPVAPPPSTPLGRLDSALDTPSRPPRVATPDSKKFAAILLESNPVELQRQLLTSTVQNQVLSERLRRAAAQRTMMLERLERARDLNEDLKFRLEEKSIELEGARALVRQLEARRSPARSGRGSPARRSHCSMRDMEPLALPDDSDSSRPAEPADTPRRRPSRIPLHTGRPASAHSVRSARSGASGRSRTSPGPAAPPRHKEREAKSAVPVRRSPAAPDAKRAARSASGAWLSALAAEYVARADRLAPLFPRARPLPRDLPASPASPASAASPATPASPASPGARSLARELERSVLYERGAAERDSLWNGKPQQYFESMNYGERAASDDDAERDEYDSDSLAP
ncbi:javelin-like isoform X2 [Anticarsia gemmatalis]